MIGLYNHDGTFFEVTSDDVDFKTVAAEDVISLDITEEMAKMDSGTIVLRDQNNIYSRIIRPGVKLFLSWGIRPRIGKAITRDKVEVMVNSPSGGGSSGGQVTFNCSFMALGFRGENANVWYETGTKADIIATVFDRLGILDKEIDFTRGTEKITAGTKVAQYESDFRFLVRMSDEWRCAFRIGRDATGKTVACFVDYGKLKSSSFALKIGGTSSVSLSYGNHASNCLSYTWKDNPMDSANGQGARIVMVDGKPQIFRTVVENETVKTYRLVPERIENELSKKDLLSRTELLAEYLSAKDFKDVSRFFVEDTTTTAPQGSGITVQAGIMGDPQVTAGLVATFTDGFPDRIGATDRTWWVRSASHKISTAGYFTDLDIADAYSFSSTGVKL